MRTAQELFDTVVAHLRKQNAKAMRTLSGYANSCASGCAYRADNGYTCAIGCLLPDDVYTSTMENNGIDTLLDGSFQLPADLRAEFIDNQDLLRSLQTTHDGYRVDQWEDRFREVAQMFKLQYTPRVSP